MISTGALSGFIKQQIANRDSTSIVIDLLDGEDLKKCSKELEFMACNSRLVNNSVIIVTPSDLDIPPFIRANIDIAVVSSQISYPERIHKYWFYRLLQYTDFIRIVESMECTDALVSYCDLSHTPMVGLYQPAAEPGAFGVASSMCECRFKLKE